MQNKKDPRVQGSSRIKQRNGVHKSGHLTKTSSHYKSQCCSKIISTIRPSEPNNKGHNASISSTTKGSKKKINNRSIIRKLNFEDKVQRKMKTENSSLSCSTHKNKINLSASKDFLKHHSVFQTECPINNATRQLTKIKRPGTSQQSTHKTIKLNSTIKSSTDLLKIVSRTKNLLEGWKQERESWYKQKGQYEWKISQLESEIGRLKEKVREGGKQARFHNIFLS